MQIYGPVHLHGSQAVAAPHSQRVAKSSAGGSSAAIQDELQISDAAMAMEQSGEQSGIRSDRVAQIRAQIADGTYETPEKMEIALGRLLDEIG
jgi:negative regulator of flagellin synthesis FlgM